LTASLLAHQPVYTFTQAVDLRARWENGSRVLYEFKTIYDIDNNSTLMSLDLSLKPKLGSGPHWSTGIGVDTIITSTGQGWVGQFQGEDRIRWRLSYAL
jgi:hypothetical protein